MTIVVNLLQRACALSCWLLCSTVKLFTSFHGNPKAREEDRSILYWTELVQIPAKEDNQDPAEISSRLSEPAELLVYGMQRPPTEHAHLVHN